MSLILDNVWINIDLPSVAMLDSSLGATFKITSSVPKVRAARPADRLSAYRTCRAIDWRTDTLYILDVFDNLCFLGMDEWT